MIAEIDEVGLAWDQLRARFELKFLPEAEKATLAHKFIDLKQGNSSVAYYVAAFESLSKYRVNFINPPLKKNQKFVHRLCKHLKKELLLKLDVSFE